MSEPIRFEESAADVIVNLRDTPAFERMASETVIVDRCELARLRKNSERWEWFLRNGLQPTVSPYPHFELSSRLRQFSYVQHIESHIDEMVQREKLERRNHANEEPTRSI